MAAASSSSSKYDVFLSFRGEDTRKSFVGHLYKALQQKAIHVFFDSEKLEKGNQISDLLAAIEDSWIAIVVLSQHYASSKWCLRELAKIMDCMDNKKQIVVPIFYQVDPSDVRNISGTFAQAFAKHEENTDLDKEELESWRSALTRLADLSGWDSRPYQDESKLIEEVVEDTFSKWIYTSANKANGGLIGMDTHIAMMNSKLCLEVNDVRVVAIWGMGGLGKTTIATAVYDKIACQFKHSCFVPNVKEAFISKREVQVQEELLSKLLKEKVQGIDLHRGRNMIMERLGMRKVLVVLDDVGTSAQIEALLGQLHAFGKGSRIIITTRVCSLADVDVTYQPKCLYDEESRELLRKHAFRTKQPSEEYSDLINQAIEYAQGLPLALKVLGSSLYKKSVRQWKDLLEKIKITPQRGILDLLKTSFDELDDLDKNIFLDIACVFRGWNQDDVTDLLHGFFPHIGLPNLVDRALITTLEDNELDMHDLLQELGREIVRESIKELGKHSRLWSYKDVDQVLTHNTASDTIECLVLELPKAAPHPYCINIGAFVRMTKLRVLRIYNEEDHCGYDLSYNRKSRKQVTSGELEFLSHELRLLEWHEYPLETLPSSFIPKNLVRLDMRGSRIVELWEENKMQPLQLLKEIRLSHSQSLVKIPDLTNAIHLKKLYLDGCSSLSELHPSISALQELEYLTLYGCKELKILPSSLHMRSLKTLCLSGCSNLEKFPDITDVMSELEDLYLDGTAIKELPSSINNITGLSYLNLSNCKELATLPSSIHLSSLEIILLTDCSNLVKFPEISNIMSKLQELDLDGTAIKELPSSINNLTGLSYLYLSHCKELTTLPSSIHFSSLISIDLTGCSNLKKFPEISGIMKKLPELCLDNTAVKGLPSSIDQLLGLQRLSIRDCKGLEFLPDSICNLADLTHLNLSGCSNLEKFPEVLDVMTQLQELNLNGTGIKALQLSINNLTGFRVLSLSNCTKLTTLTSSIYLSSLISLDLTGCSNLEKFPEISGIMEKLPELHLDGTAIKGLPSSIDQLLGLKILTMRNCKCFEFLPDSICNLADLTHLDLSGCSALHNLPEKLGDLKSLTHLNVVESGIKHFPLSILRLKKQLAIFSFDGCIEMVAPFSSWSSLIGYFSFAVLVHLDLSDCNLLELPDSVADLSSLKTLKLCRNNFESLPVTMDRLGCLTHLILKACKKLKSIPELPSINYLDAHCCTALETVSTPKTGRTILDFRFSNCFQLVQTNLFTDFLHQGYHPQSLSCKMCSPGSDIPNWFSHQSRASSVTVQLPRNWFDKMFLGFAICTVSCFNKADPSYAPHLAALCYCTFKGNHGEHKFSFHLRDWDFTGDDSLQSDHLFMEYVSWSKFSLAEKGEPVNERYYTEATFKIVVESVCNSRSERHCMSSYGVRFFHESYMEVHNESWTHLTDHVELGAPSFPDQLEIRSETEWEAESSEMAARRGTCRTLELLLEPQTERKEEHEMVAVAARREGCQVLGSVCCCLSLSGCTTMPLRWRETEREGESGTRISDDGDVLELCRHSGLVVPNSQQEGQEERELTGDESLPATGLLGRLSLLGLLGLLGLLVLTR